MHFCHKEHPEYAETAEVLTYMDYRETEPWAGTSLGQRGDSYKQFKRRKAERLIDALEQEMPGIRDDIEEYYTSTPLTWRDYTGVPEGAMSMRYAAWYAGRAGRESDDVQRTADGRCAVFTAAADEVAHADKDFLLN